MIHRSPNSFTATSSSTHKGYTLVELLLVLILLAFTLMVLAAAIGFIYYVLKDMGWIT